MPGKRAASNGDFVTQRALYRRDVEAVDADVTSDSIPILNTLNSDYGGQVENNDVNTYGRNAQLDLALISTGPATLQLWMLAEVEESGLISLGDSSSSSSSSGEGAEGALVLPATGAWVFVEEKIITQSELWIITNVPPGKFKVIMVANTNTVHILEQHAA